MLTTLKPGFYLGIDAGGSKTEAIIAKESGFIVGQGFSAGANPHNTPLDLAVKHINAAVTEAITQANQRHSEINIKTFESVCFGMAGLDTEADRKKITDHILSLDLKQTAFISPQIFLVSDGLIGLKSGTEKSWGVCLIAGTGSNCYGLSPSGKEATAGDWGYILGDQGSAFTIGQAILKRVMKEYDGREPTTTLTRQVLKFLNLKHPTELIPWVYQQTIPIREIASLSQLASDIALSDSVEISAITNQTVLELSNAYAAVVRRLSLPQNQEFPVVLIGGLFKMKSHFSDMIIRSLLNLTPTASVVFPSKSPAEGAVQIALIGSQHHLLPETAITIKNPTGNSS